jgi:hypothetical protein
MLRKLHWRSPLLAAVAVLTVGVAGAAAAPARHARDGHHGGKRGRTVVTLNQTTIATVVNDLHLTPAAVAPGTLGMVGGELQAAFPIRGEIEHGTIRHRGGLSLTSGSTKLSLTRYTIDTRKGILTARVGQRLARRADHAVRSRFRSRQGGLRRDREPRAGRCGRQGPGRRVRAAGHRGCDLGHRLRHGVRHAGPPPRECRRRQRRP